MRSAGAVNRPSSSRRRLGLCWDDGGADGGGTSLGWRDSGEQPGVFCKFLPVFLMRCANRAKRRMTRDRSALAALSVRPRRLRSMPRCSAGSNEAGSGNSCLASGSSRCGLRAMRSDSAVALSGLVTTSGTRRRGLGMLDGRPRALPEAAVCEAPARVARARQKRIRTKSLRFLDSGPGK
jgi:hypothetical protein